MKILKNGIIALLLTISLVSVKAQEAKENRREKMEALKISFITEKLELTTEEAKNFWPIYNDYNSAKKEIKKEKPKGKKPNFDEMTDAEVENFIDSKTQELKKLMDLKILYIEKFKKVLPIKKVAKLLGIERDFKREVLKKMREKQ